MVKKMKLHLEKYIVSCIIGKVEFFLRGKNALKKRLKRRAFFVQICVAAQRQKNLEIHKETDRKETGYQE